MERLKRAKPSPSMTIALLALFVALGGSAIAASDLNRNEVKSKHLKNGGVKLADLAPNSVDSSKIVDASVAAVDIANAAVSGAALADGSVTTAKLADAAVTGAKLANASVNTAKLADDAVTGAKIANGTIGQGDLGSNSVSSGKFKTNATVSVDFANMAANTCTSFTTTAAPFDTVAPTDEVHVTPPEAKPFNVMVTAGTLETTAGIYIDACAIGSATNPAAADYEITIIE